MDTNVKRGDIFYADLSPVVGSEQGGTRPVLIVQNDTGNRHSPTVIVLRYFTGLTLAETAETLGVPVGTVSTRQRRALALLRLELEEDAI